MNNPVLAIDGGGTKCKATLYDHTGALLAEAVSGPANLFLDFELAKQSIMNAANACLLQTNSQRSDTISIADVILSAGCAGANIKTAATQFNQWKSEFYQKFVTTDLHISCLAANHNKDCGLVIVGTGSAVARFKNNKVTQFGGHGFELGDKASGAWMGKSAIKTALECLDCLHDDDEFVSMVMRTTKCHDGQEIISKYAKESAATFASLAPEVFRLANSGNKLAHRIVAQGANYICSILRNNDFASLPDCYIVGGIADALLPYLQSQLGFSIQLADTQAEYGAFLYAQTQP